MKYFVPFVAAFALLGTLVVSGCGNRDQTKPVAVPPEASPQVMQQQAQVRAQQEAGGLAVMQQHMHQSGPPPGAPGAH